MNLREEINQKAQEIDNILERYLPREEGYQTTVFEAMNYSVRAGGKRPRPMLMQETYRLFGGEGALVEPFMAAIEMIHTYSLVHDDLPAMDNDMLRRGKPTTHAVYGEAMGILAGDALQNYAFETALTAFDLEPENPGVPAALKLLAGKSGVYGMLGGQVVDVESEQMEDISRERLDFIYRLKTGALIEASMMIGAVLAGASKEETAAVERIAGKVGLAFQIQDDILDVAGDEAVLGKPVGSDEKNQKATYVVFEGLEKSREDVRRLSEEAIEQLKSLPGDSRFLEGLLGWLIHRDR